MAQKTGRKPSKFLTYNGITASVSEWSRRCNINLTVLLGRLNRGWSIPDALTTPVAVFDKHRLTGHPLVPIWREMLRRCYDSRMIYFSRYGGRGIRVCARWHKVQDFIRDLEPRPDGHSLDRVNNDGHYSCGNCDECALNGWTANCRWATPKQQQLNKRTNHVVTYDGKTQSLTLWAEDLDIDRSILYDRIQKRNWDIQRALTQPPQSRTRHL